MQVVSSNREFRADSDGDLPAEGFEVSGQRNHGTGGQGRAAGMDRDGTSSHDSGTFPCSSRDWPRWLEERSRLGPVLALLGFADRATVSQARAAGAAACLDLPVDVQ